MTLTLVDPGLTRPLVSKTLPRGQIAPDVGLASGDLGFVEVSQRGQIATDAGLASGDLGFMEVSPRG